MKKVDVTFPEFMFIVGTRAFLALGVGLLAAGKLDRATRRALGTTLIAIGALTTIPAALALSGKNPGAVVKKFFRAA